MNHDEIVSELNKLSNITNELKKKIEKPKDKFEFFKEYAGIISLVLGLITGFFGVWDKIYTGPRSDREAEKESLNTTISKIFTIEQTLVHTKSLLDQEALSAQQSLLLQQAEDLCSRDPKIATFSDEFSLGKAYLFLNNYPPALSHFQSALKLAIEIPDKTMAEGYIASMEFHNIDSTSIDQARSKFNTALEQVVGLNTAKGLYAHAYILGLECVTECGFGDRNRAQALKAQEFAFLENLKTNPNLPPPDLKSIASDFQTGLHQTGCENN